MPVLKIKKNGSWVEVWGATSGASGGSLPKLTTINIPASGWEGADGNYSQVLNINGVNANSKLDLLPSPSQFNSLQNEGVALTISNNNGVVTIFAISGKPTSDYDMQLLITDVEVIV